MISIVMIFLDAERFIAESIDSVLGQTHDCWELVLVDDGSSDGSTEIARRYASEYPDRIRYVDHPGHANRGMSASRNLGVARAHGELVAFLDADDVFLPDRLAVHARVFESNPGLQAVQSCLQYWRSWNPAGDGTATDAQETAPLGEYTGIIAPPRLLLLLLESRGATVPGICSLTLRRNVYQDLGGCDESFRGLYEDQVLWCKLYLRHGVFVMPDVLARYRQHPASTVGQAGESGMLAARRRLLDWLEQYTRASSDLDLSRALRKAMFEYRHPRLWALGRAPGDLMRRLRRAGYGLLPGSLADPIRNRWREHKELRTQRLLERARTRAGIPDER
jgi:glycosyltransferase involved in cell wall biosynthesis